MLDLARIWLKEHSSREAIPQEPRRFSDKFLTTLRRLNEAAGETLRVRGRRHQNPCVLAWEMKKQLTPSVEQTNFSRPFVFHFALVSTNSRRISSDANRSAGSALTLKHYRADVILNKGLSTGWLSSIFACVPQVKLHLEDEPHFRGRPEHVCQA
jgi:hypothetical protein